MALGVPILKHFRVCKGEWMHLNVFHFFLLTKTTFVLNLGCFVGLAFLILGNKKISSRLMSFSREVNSYQDNGLVTVIVTLCWFISHLWNYLCLICKLTVKQLYFAIP